MRLEKLVNILDEVFPHDLAESWDRVGLSVGDTRLNVRRIGFAVDPCQATVDELRARDGQLLITHHPLFLRGTSTVASTFSKGRWVTDLIQAGAGLYSAHTNADVLSSSQALAELIGMKIEAPLDEASGIGAVGILEVPCTARELAQRLSGALPDTPAGVLLGGDADRMISSVALCSGAGDSFLELTRTLGVDAYITADLRHHRATDHLWAAGPVLICPTHWASEWPLLAHMRQRLLDRLASEGEEIDTYISTLVTDPWVARF